MGRPKREGKVGAILSANERYKITKKWIKKVFGEDQEKMKIEGLGTYATYGKYRQYPVNRLALDKEGNPDFEKELKLVQQLMKQTYEAPTPDYTPTEGDVIRGITKELER
jgi:hypothetical protein